MQAVTSFLINSISLFGYAGIFILMFLESSFFPFPSEVVMIPAGYLAQRGTVNLFSVIILGISGSYFGALFNYFLARKYGRAFLIKYHKYLFISPKLLGKLEDFFNRHGHITTFNGRLIPGVRQYISLPAGLSKMDILKFSIYTVLGAGIWVIILTMLGYFIGQNQELIRKYLHIIIVTLSFFIIIITCIYVAYIKRRKKSH